jgi:hypothetical protein
MPIRINLLAEQQAAEELRRRDPVKRATMATGIVFGLLLLWGGYLQIKLMGAMREVNRYEKDWKALENEYNLVSSNLNRVAEAESRISALYSLATNRFLWGSVLNALQYTLVEDVQLVRLKTEQSYTLTEGTKASTNKATGVVTKGKPGTSKQRVTLTIEAKDYSNKPGDQVPKFQERLNNEPFFKTNLQKSELTGLSPVQSDAANPGRQYKQFTLECQFQEKLR